MNKIAMLDYMYKIAISKAWIAENLPLMLENRMGRLTTEHYNDAVKLDLESMDMLAKHMMGIKKPTKADSAAAMIERGREINNRRNKLQAAFEGKVRGAHEQKRRVEIMSAKKKQ